MIRWAAYFPYGCAVFGLVWLALSGSVIMNRALYDWRHRSGTIGSLSRNTVERLAADSATPPRQAEAFAIQALAGSGAEKLARAARRHRGETSKWSRIVALRILAIGQHRETFPLLERALADEDPDVVGAAVTLLGRLNNERAALMLIGVLERVAYTPSRVATQLDRFSFDISDLIRPLLRHSVPVVRFWASTLLARYAGTLTINAELAALVHDPDASVRKAVVETLGKAGGPHAANTAAALIDDPNWYVRAHAARALADLGRVDLSHLITPLLADRQWWVRLAAKESLEKMGPAVVSELILFLDYSPDSFARNGVAEVLQNIGMLDHLITETLQSDRGDPEKTDLIQKIMHAGGSKLVNATLERIQPAFSPGAIRLLRAGLKPVRMS